jgi:peptidoglycan hydrolase CwlO-like protein
VTAVSPVETLARTSTTTTVDRETLVAMLREKDQLLQELEAECRGLAEQLMAFQNEILKWVELDR